MEGNNYFFDYWYYCGLNILCPQTQSLTPGCTCHRYLHHCNSAFHSYIQWKQLNEGKATHACTDGSWGHCPGHTAVWACWHGYVSQRWTHASLSPGRTLLCGAISSLYVHSLALMGLPFVLSHDFKNRWLQHIFGNICAVLMLPVLISLDLLSSTLWDFCKDSNNIKMSKVKSERFLFIKVSQFLNLVF